MCGTNLARDENRENYEEIFDPQANERGVKLKVTQLWVMNFGALRLHRLSAFHIKLGS